MDGLAFSLNEQTKAPKHNLNRIGNFSIEMDALSNLVDRYKQWQINRYNNPDKAVRSTLKDMLGINVTPEGKIDASEFGLGIGGTIQGPLSKLANLDTLKKAKAMQATKQYTADDIFKKTKWFLDHPDGVPRFEVSDKGMDFNLKAGAASQPMTKAEAVLAQITGNLPASPRRQSMGLHDSVYGDSFSKGYSNADIRTIRDPDTAPKDGSVFPSADGGYQITHAIPRERTVATIEEVLQGKTGKKVDDPYVDDIRDTLVHELQHVIQLKEGMSPGGATEFFTPFTKDRPEAFDMYENLAGEIEARLASTRKHMPQTELDADPFYKYYPKVMSMLSPGKGKK